MTGNDLLRLLLRIAAYACIGFGAIFALIAGGWSLHTRSFLKSASTADAVVVRFVQMQDADNNTTNSAPVFSFTAQDGQSYTIQSNTSSNPPEFSVGQHVEVKYDPSQPSGAKINSFMQLWFVPAIFGPIGTFAVLVGLGLLAIKRVIDRKSSTVTGHGFAPCILTELKRS